MPGGDSHPPLCLSTLQHKRVPRAQEPPLRRTLPARGPSGTAPCPRAGREGRGAAVPAGVLAGSVLGCRTPQACPTTARGCDCGSHLGSLLCLASVKNSLPKTLHHAGRATLAPCSSVLRPAAWVLQKGSSQHPAAPCPSPRAARCPASHPGVPRGADPACRQRWGRRGDMVEPTGDRLLPGWLVLPPRPRDTSKAPAAAAGRAACPAFVLPPTGDISWGIWLLGGCLSAQGCALGGPESGEPALGCVGSRVLGHLALQGSAWHIPLLGNVPWGRQSVGDLFWGVQLSTRLQLLYGARGDEDSTCPPECLGSRWQGQPVPVSPPSWCQSAVAPDLGCHWGCRLA